MVSQPRTPSFCQADSLSAEWSFQYLRTQAQTRREKLIVQKVEDIVVEEQTSPPSQSYQGNMDVPLLAANGVPIGPERDPTAVDDNEEDWHSVDSGRSILHDTTIASLRCECDGHVGKLVISADDIAFRSSLAKRELWRRPYLELAEMKKVRTISPPNLTTATNETRTSRSTPLRRPNSSPPPAGWS